MLSVWFYRHYCNKKQEGSAIPYPPASDTTITAI